MAGTKLAVSLGNKIVVSTGLASLAIAYVWTSQVSTSTSYAEIVGQMVFLGLGMGLTSAPATESNMGAVSIDKAVIGSIYASLYTDAFAKAEAVPEAARESVGAALIAAQELPGNAGSALAQLASTGLFDGAPGRLPRRRWPVRRGRGLDRPGAAREAAGNARGPGASRRARRPPRASAG